MSFDIRSFADTNKVILIWAAFAALLYLLQDLFGLIFVTYVMCFLTNSMIVRVRNVVNVNRRFLVVLVYVLFLVGIGGFLFFFTPTLIQETKSFTDQIPQAIRTVEAWVSAHTAEQEWLPQLLAETKEHLTPEQIFMKGWSIGRGLLEKTILYTSLFFLGLLFSFMIMLDLPGIMANVRTLKTSRLAPFYEQTAGSVVLFATVVGESIRAQIMISAVDTALMAICLYLMGINNIVLLCTLIFFTGLVPVLGVFLSAAPIFLVAVNSGGINLGLWSLGLVALISLTEAYVLNPRIVSAIMSINPVLTLIILYIAYSFFGLWGMFLGVPIAVYIYRQLIIVPLPDHAVARG